VKAAAVSKKLRRRHEELLVHSGQHYDDELSAIFFKELDLPPPDRELHAGSCTATEQVIRIMRDFEGVLKDVQPDLTLVYGDTNTTLAGALACAHLDRPLAHVEAGMRSFDHEMPEERNRVLTDHLCELRLCSTTTAVANLGAEGVKQGVELVGDVMADVSLQMWPVAERKSDALERYGLEPGGYLLVTAHRAGNVDRDERLEQLVALILELPLQALFPVHPRTRVRLEQTGLLDRLEAAQHVMVTEPLGFLDFLKLLRHASAVVTDSGGVQKEAYLAMVPCLTLRDETEWPETVALGWNRLVGLDRARVLEALSKLERPPLHPDLYRAGRAGDAIVAATERWWARRCG
jgi:UDP-N-acetylglucosamine 2-epimerase (non-hydrolysing)/UDP-GlcNAc3NAcA epimerase